MFTRVMIDLLFSEHGLLFLSSYCSKEEKLHLVAVQPMQFIKHFTSLLIMLNVEEGIKNSEEMAFKILRNLNSLRISNEYGGLRGQK